MENKSGKYWPYGIIGGMACFILFIGYIVFRVSSEQVDLVKEDYYQKELQYQDKIDAQNRSIDIIFDYSAETKLIKIAFPTTTTGIKGIVKFYRPSDEKLDFILPLELDAQGEQILSTEKLSQGFWRVEMECESEGKSFFKETSFQR